MTVIQGEKGKKQSSPKQPPPPVEAKNTLRSVSKGKILDLLAHGPIEGLVAGLESVYLDGTRLKNPGSDTLNFEGVTVTTREGYPDQPVVQGFKAVENPVQVGAAVKYGLPIVRAVSNDDADAVVVTIQVNSLSLADTKTGNLDGYSTTVVIDVKGRGGAWMNRVTDVIVGKTTSPYQRSYRIELDQLGPWEVRVQRPQPDDDKNVKQSAFSWATMTEVVDARLNYPDCALVGLELDSRLFGGNMPARAYDVKLSIIRVPSNYNPITRAYSGLWNGQFKMAWTDNPAWVYYDLATHPVIGAGIKNVDKWGLYQIAQYCDQLVPDGYGHTEPRFTVNTLLNDRQEAITVLSTLASVFRGMTYWGTDTVVAVGDMPVDAKKLVGPANVVDGDFEYSGTSLKERHSVAVVMWNDPSDMFVPKPEVVEDADSIDLFGWKETTVTAFACSSRGQAHRLGKWILYSERNETETVTYRAVLDQADLRPGDIINLSDPDRAAARLSGRLAVSDVLAPQLDKVPPELGAHTWYLNVVLPAGSIERRRVSSFVGQVANLAAPFSVKPVPGAMWILSSIAAEPPQYRVVSNAENDDGTYQITATEYRRDKYAAVEYDLRLAEVSNSLIPTGEIAPPSDITVVPHKYIAGGTEHQALTISWSAGVDPRIAKYVLELQGPADQGFRTAYVGGGLSYEEPDAVGGPWVFRVRAITALSIGSIWISRTVNIAQLLLPSPPDSVEYEAGVFSVALRPKSLYPTAVFEFWRSLVPLQSIEIESNAVRVGVATTLLDGNLSPDTEYFYYIRGTNAYGVSSWYPVAVSTSDDPGEVLKALSGQIKESHLYQALSGRIDLIDADDQVPGSVSARLKAVNDVVADNIASIREQLEKVAAAPAYDPTKSYPTGAVVVSASKLFKAKQGVPVGAAPPALAYWEDLGDYADINQFTAALAVKLKAVDNLVTDTADGVQAISRDMEGVFAQLNPTMAGSADPAGSTEVLAGVWSESYARANATEALTKRIDQTMAEIGQVAASLTEEIGARATADGALAYHVQAMMTNMEGAKALILEESRVRSEADLAVAEHITSLTSTVNGQSAAIQQVASVINGVSASYTLKLDVNGYVAGYGLYNDGVVSSFGVRADRFFVADPTSKEEVLPFIIQDGKVYMNTTMIKDATIHGAKIANATISSAKIGSVIMSDAVNSFGDPVWALSKDGMFRFNGAPGVQSRIEFKDSNGTVRLQIGEYNG